MKLSDFDFDLPEDLIAQSPARPRDSARMLAVTPDALEDRGVLDLPRYLRPGDVLVVNDTKVIPARLTGRRGEAKVEATLLKDLGDGRWAAFARPGKRLRIGDRLVFAEDFAATLQEKRDGGETVLAFGLKADAMAEALARYGAPPLPPYIKRKEGAAQSDADDYQTAFAEKGGAVAAPTAALHFTPRLISAVEAAGAEFVRVTLHVGAGTFLPVKVDDVSKHRMHSEWGAVSASAAAAINAARRVISVGTTPLRILESAAAPTGSVEPFEGETDIFITPGYRFQAVDALMTNFHLPKSTLMMLVSALMSRERMMEAYAHAVQERYRFFSYGDSSLLMPEGFLK